MPEGGELNQETKYLSSTYGRTPGSSLLNSPLLAEPAEQGVVDPSTLIALRFA